jgi:hypothetical protein
MRPDKTQLLKALNHFDLSSFESMGISILIKTKIKIIQELPEILIYPEIEQSRVLIRSLSEDDIIAICSNEM